MVRLGIAEADVRCWVTVEGQLDRHSSEWFREHLVALGTGRPGDVCSGHMSLA